MQTLELKITEFGPQDLLQLTKLFSHIPGTILLFSGGNFRTSKQNILCLFPYETFFLKDDQKNNPWETLDTKISNNSSEIPVEWVGYLHYEMGFYAEGFEAAIHDPANLGYFQRSCVTIVQDLVHKTISIYVSDNDPIKSENKLWIDKFLCKEKFLQLLIESNIYSSPITESSLELIKAPEEIIDYIEKINYAKEQILDGNIYQINLSQQILLKGTVDPFLFFDNILKINPAPYSAYLCIDTDHYIVSSSPEQFLKCENGILESCPIKGTMPRYEDPEEDSRSQQKLLCSEKERSELLMITDLMRNDLGKISLSGTVVTEAIWLCEAYTNVFHLLSIIKGVVKKNISSVNAIRSCFPGGSITGCPKISAMKQIKQIEKRQRGIYTGSIGYFSKNDNFNFNIAIRTVSFVNEIIDIQLGGGIVSDSDSEHEYKETMQKGKSIFKALNIL